MAACAVVATPTSRYRCRRKRSERIERDSWMMKGLSAPFIDYTSDSPIEVDPSRTILQTRSFPSCPTSKPPPHAISLDAIPRLPTRGGSQRSLKINKQVTFDDESSHSVHVYPAIPKHMFPAVYFSRKEISEIRSSSKLKARAIIAGDKAVIQSLLVLHGLRKYHAFLSEQDATRIILHSDVRGLEHFITPRFCKHRRWAVHQVLHIQKEHAGQMSGMTSNLMRMWSVKLSAPSCLFARNIAMTDAHEAR